MSIYHFILTRFNLRGPKQDKNQIETWNNPEWLQHRIQLFETYCFPSIRSQYQQNFKFLVGFDSETDPQIYQKYQTYQNYVPILVPLGSNFGKEVIQYINQQTQPNLQPKQQEIHPDQQNIQQKNIVITTRIDSDDAFSRQAVKTIQQLAKQSQPAEILNQYLALDFHRGLYLNEKTETLQAEMIHFTSAYGSLVEYLPIQSQLISKTVISFNQGNLTKENPTIHIRTGPPLWVRVIHTRNILNDQIIKEDHHAKIVDQDFIFLKINYRRQIMTKPLTKTNETNQIQPNTKPKTVSTLTSEFVNSSEKIKIKNTNQTSTQTQHKVKTKKLSKRNIKAKRI